MAKCSVCGRTRGGCPHTSILSEKAQQGANDAAMRRKRGTIEFSNTRRKGKR